MSLPTRTDRPTAKSDSPSTSTIPLGVFEKESSVDSTKSDSVLYLAKKIIENAKSGAGDSFSTAAAGTRRGSVGNAAGLTMGDLAVLAGVRPVPETWSGAGIAIKAEEIDEETKAALLEGCREGEDGYRNEDPQRQSDTGVAAPVAVSDRPPADVGTLFERAIRDAEMMADGISPEYATSLGQQADGSYGRQDPSPPFGHAPTPLAQVTTADGQSITPPAQHNRPSPSSVSQISTTLESSRFTPPSPFLPPFTTQPNSPAYGSSPSPYRGQAYRAGSPRWDSWHHQQPALPYVMQPQYYAPSYHYPALPNPQDMTGMGPGAHHQLHFPSPSYSPTSPLLSPVMGPPLSPPPQLYSIAPPIGAPAGYYYYQPQSGHHPVTVTGSSNSSGSIITGASHQPGPDTLYRPGFSQALVSRPSGQSAHFPDQDHFGLGLTADPSGAPSAPFPSRPQGSSRPQSPLPGGGQAGVYAPYQPNSSSQYGLVPPAYGTQEPPLRHSRNSSHASGGHPNNGRGRGSGGREQATTGYGPGLPVPQSPYRSVPFQSPIPPFTSGAQEARPGRPVPPNQSFSPSSAAVHAGGSPPVLERGQLAQAKLHDALGQSTPSASQQLHESRQSRGVRSALPRPPSHSEFAMWVGNVPGDATYEELWQFFNSKPPPISAGITADPNDPTADVHSSGVDSIHLISRSNCAFVNYVSEVHLHHAIKVSNGTALRIHNPRLKEFVCRIRKKGDDTKTGVGAQRGKGMHHQWVADQAALAKQQGGANVGEYLDRQGPPPLPQHQSSDQSASAHSVSTSSTTSSFLARNFAKRYFILKSHTEDDLHLSVERGLWATQSHNEPVLDQAYRTSKEGVFLIFGANKSGGFFGYAQMTGPILSNEQRISWASRTDGESSGSSLRNEPIPEGSAAHYKSPSSSPFVPTLLPPSEARVVSMSPQPLSPDPQGNHEVRDLHSQYEKGERASAPDVMKRALKSHDPSLLSELESRRHQSLDPHHLDQVEDAMGKVSISSSSNPVHDQLVLGSTSHEGQLDDYGVWRKDTILSPEERNARLEKFEEEAEARGLDVGAGGMNEMLDGKRTDKGLDRGWGRPFKVEWIRVQRVPFSRTRHLRNPFNFNKEVKISRDGTEIEPQVGEALLAEFWKDSSSSPTTRTLDLQSLPQQTSSSAHLSNLPDPATLHDPARSAYRDEA